MNKCHINKTYTQCCVSIALFYFKNINVKVISTTAICTNMHHIWHNAKSAKFFNKFLSEQSEYYMSGNFKML